MRCLRQIGDGQQTGRVYLSEENEQILNDELQQNFRVSIEEIQNTGADKVDYKVKVNKPPVKVKLMRIQKTHELVEKQPQKRAVFGTRSSRHRKNIGSQKKNTKVSNRHNPSKPKIEPKSGSNVTLSAR